MDKIAPRNRTIWNVLTHVERKKWREIYDRANNTWREWDSAQRETYFAAATWTVFE